MRDMLNFIRPPEDAEWKVVNRWRWNVCLTLIVLGGSMAWSYGPRGFASEGSVDKKIADAQKPLVEAQRKTEEKVDRMSVLLLAQLVNSKAAEIRNNISKRCKTAGAIEKEELNREKDKLQEQYYELKGQFYKEPMCAEL